MENRAGNKIKPGTSVTDKAVIDCLKLPLHLMTSLGLVMIKLFLIFKIPPACSFKCTEDNNLDLLDFN